MELLKPDLKLKERVLMCRKDGGLGRKRGSESFYARQLRTTLVTSYRDGTDSSGCELPT